MRLPFRITFTNYFHRSILVQQSRCGFARIPDQALHCLTLGNVVQTRKIQVFGEAVVPKVTFLEGRAALEDQRLVKLRHPADASQDPGQQVVPFQGRAREFRDAAALPGGVYEAVSWGDRSWQVLLYHPPTVAGSLPGSGRVELPVPLDGDLGQAFNIGRFDSLLLKYPTKTL